jgi:probable F420-dependent oxidoreductase
MSPIDVDQVGMWDFHLNYHDVEQVRAWVAELEQLGLGSIWVGEALFREPFTLAGVLLSATSNLTVATGITNIWVRDAFATVAAQLTLAEAYPDRFLLGVGVSHRQLVENERGHRYEKPLSTMNHYLDRMDEAWDKYKASKPDHRPKRVLAALGPRMLELATERADGAHTYFVPPEHTHLARQVLGPSALLVPEQAVVLEEDPNEARRVARTHIRRYLPLPNYTRNLRRLGFDEADFDDDGSDRLVDAIVAHGSVTRIGERIRAHREAGASHVCLHVLSPTYHQFPIEQWRTLLRSH